MLTCHVRNYAKKKKKGKEKKSRKGKKEDGLDLGIHPTATLHSTEGGRGGWLYPHRRVLGVEIHPLLGPGWSHPIVPFVKWAKVEPPQRPHCGGRATLRCLPIWVDLQLLFIYLYIYFPLFSFLLIFLSIIVYVVC